MCGSCICHCRLIQETKHRRRVHLASGRQCIENPQRQLKCSESNSPCVLLFRSSYGQDSGLFEPNLDGRCISFCVLLDVFDIALNPYSLSFGRSISILVLGIKLEGEIPATRNSLFGRPYPGFPSRCGQLLDVTKPVYPLVQERFFVAFPSRYGALSTLEMA